MTFQKVIDRQIQLRNWIDENFRPMKRFQNSWSSMLLLRIVQRYFPDVSHEEFKQAMFACGYFADCTKCDEYYTKVYFNVSQTSIDRVREKSQYMTKERNG